MARILVIALVLLISTTALAQIEGTYEVHVSKKAEEKKSHRWTLKDWLAWKEQTKAMDMWLARNSHSSSFEFYLEASALNYGLMNSQATAPVGNYNLYSGELAAYAGVAGLRGSYENSQENQSGWFGSFNLRLFGRAIQDTHINLEYGLHGLTLAPAGQTAENFQNQFGGATLALYFTKHFGIEGTYRKILPATSDQNRGLEGEISSGVLFIDFSALRVFGRWSREYRQYWQSGSTSGEFRERWWNGLYPSSTNFPYSTPERPLGAVMIIGSMELLDMTLSTSTISSAEISRIRAILNFRKIGSWREANWRTLLPIDTVCSWPLARPKNLRRHLYLNSASLISASIRAE